MRVVLRMLFKVMVMDSVMLLYVLLGFGKFS